ncbi:ABC transporter permease [Streptomyces sp. NPDC096198]|uniref:ABC transporter permease n=1 Tax=Streptomyces sp. NPDC096198 TaxID=3366080 RepID=UPI003814BF60
MRVRQLSRDLVMGARFAFAGGREGWIRLLLTGVGVGLGVSLLLLTTVLPGALSTRYQREDARADHTYGRTIPRADNTLVIADVDTTYRATDVRGRVMEPEGSRAPLPPGLERFPRPGEMVVSPALKTLLASDEGRLLRERLPYRVVGTIAERGLVGSHELAYYAGGTGLGARIDPPNVARIDRFGSPDVPPQRSDPVLLLLMIVVFVVLLMPVGVFIAAAVRFGGERRDRRLAALRLVGADSAMTRRIAAGEALAGAVLGLAVGTVLFLAGRQVAGSVDVFGVSVFPSYLNPSPGLALLVAVAVPTAAVLVTLFALRGVVIEPLGVVRTAKPPRRRLWWRLLLPLAGLGTLYPLIGKGRDNGNFNEYQVICGVLLLLVGVTALLPWAVEAVVARLSPGPVAWQLAIRRLQLSSGTAARMVNGIAVAVAGAIALQMLFSGLQGNYTKELQHDVTRAQMQLGLAKKVPVDPVVGALKATKGVRGVIATGDATLGDRRQDAQQSTEMTVGDCASLREFGQLASCRDGDVFVVKGAEFDTGTPKLAKPGRTLYLDPSTRGDEEKHAEIPWTVPHGLKQALPRKSPNGATALGLLVTRGALPTKAVPAFWGTVYISIDPSVPDAKDYVRNTTARVAPYTTPQTWAATEESARFTSIRTGLFVGATCVLALIGASLLVSQLEQLRERKKLLSSLVAFGTRRRTLGLSVLWQTAIPIALGLLLASLVGLTLGAVLLRMTSATVAIDWASVLTMSGLGAAVVLVVTLLSLPPLLRLMRADGLRTE